MYDGYIDNNREFDSKMKARASAACMRAWSGFVEDNLVVARGWTVGKISHNTRAYATGPPFPARAIYT